MTSHEARNRRVLTTAAVAVLAVGAGFGIARFTARPATAPAGASAVAANGPRTLELPAAYLATASIVVQPVTAGNLTAEVLAPATVAPAPNGEAVVTAHAAGTVTRLTKRLGDPVRAGEVLALIESREAAGAAADRSVADAKAALARKIATREQHLFDQHVTARQDLETAQAELVVAEAEARRAGNAAAAVRVAGDGRSASVASPLSGRITAQAIALGAYVRPETELFRVADVRFVQVEAAVTGADAARIAPGDAAVLTTPAGDTVNAVVRSVTPTLSAQSRAATVVLVPTAAAAPLTPGVTLQARILPRAAGPGGVVIPDEAVQSLEGHDVVFVRSAKGFIVQPVVVTSRSAGRASISAGLRVGQNIATRNAFLLKAEFSKGAGSAK
ncbi:efflux RND transporter periplasmic adaptor subunit [Phenylobacterium sp.]|uniref:efflux RND transporter periplasmic adaptor subunit n=1 Tax=Phenylobacterium sp. TaxID=1871053 RepID=UPI00286B0F0D|nr:efflux RND transporter periplasmic adaptor subunit [Phenylobacterium sp.]